MNLFLVLAYLFGLLSYLSWNSVLSALMLVMMMVSMAPLIGMLSKVWFGYMFCMVFVSGIMVLMMYFASLSKLSVKSNFYLVVLLPLCILSGSLYFLLEMVNVDWHLGFYYSEVYMYLFVFMLFCLIVLLGIINNYLIFSGGMREL